MMYLLMPSETRVRGAAAEMDKYLRQIAAEGNWPVGDALPTTRALGEKFGVANTTASRVLQRLESEGLVWRQDNGRYFLESSRQLLHRPKPIACLTRELERWSAVYRDIMAGVSTYTSDLQTALLLWRSESLVSHSDVEQPPKFGSLDQQEDSLDDFERCYGETHGGLIIDDIWNDQSLAQHPTLLKNAVILYRDTELPDVGNVCIDTREASLLALSHLLARGYEEIWVARPFLADVATESMVSAMEEAVKKTGTGTLLCRVYEAGTPAERRALVGRAVKSKRKIGLFCPEDNVSQFLFKELLSQGADCPGQIGLLSGMGTSALGEKAISSLVYDFREMGRRAAEMLCSRKIGLSRLSPDLQARATT